ncbi:phage replisome organizer N-terminal domain-containing protein [Anaerosinus massiliensis]|uniref:phage replisome organizer N-terminal domain-containing protein n=1 Tax=Massilibacillus massiliensis TaxID=1806837 RepID=UPI000A55F9D8|nr:phage replisome organizer N-terminal domain-containing protein [Massilibacillus massiliensis]
MAEKKYYWLKLKNDFFTQKEIKKLRKIAGGDTYTVIYLKIQLLSLQNGGKILFDHVEDSFAEELALELDEDVENVTVTLSFLERYKLIEKVETNEFLLTETVKCIGSESTSAERVRKHRQGKKLLQCNAPVTIGNTEIEKDIELEKEIDTELELEPPKLPKKRKSKKQLETPTVQKHQYAEFVAMTNAEYQALVDNERLGTHTAVNRCIEILDNWKGANGKKYKSDYRAILTWVIDRYEEEKQRENRLNTYNQKTSGGGLNPQAEMARRAIEMLKQQKGQDDES